MFLPIRTPTATLSQVATATEWEIYGAPLTTQQAAIDTVNASGTDTLGTFLIIDLSTRQVTTTILRSVTSVTNPT